MTLFNARSSREKQREIAVQDRIRARTERFTIASLRRSFARLANRIADYNSDAGLETAIGRYLFDNQADVARILGEAYRSSIDAIGRHVVRESPKHWRISETKSPETIMDQIIARWMSDVALDRAQTITKTTKKIINKILQDVINEGLGERETAKRIAKRVKSISLPRARLIARTEIHDATQQASLEIATDLSPDPTRLTKEWVAARDERTRHSHRDVSGTVVPRDAKFDVGDKKMMRPGDRAGGASEVINCRCVLVFDEED